MYGLVIVWTSMDDGPYWVILLKHGSHDVRHIGFRRLMVVNGTPGFWGVTIMIGTLRILYEIFLKFLMLQQIFFLLCIIQLHIGSLCK